MTYASATRRRFLAGAGAAVGLSSLAGCLSGGDRELDNIEGPDSFVQRDGPRFTVGGDPFVYNGAQVGISTTGVPIIHDPRDWIDTAFEFLADHNVEVTRTWGYPESHLASRTHPEPGTFDDTWFENFLDYAIVKAKQEGIRLILPLVHGVHYHPDSPPSTEAYATWSDTAEDRNDFFEDQQANEYYKNYIEHVLTRENSITGVEYRNDPTIMMWECGNEADYAARERRYDSLAFWYDEIASYIKSIDDNHLVGSGMHGSMGEIYEDWTWRNNFVEEHRSNAIDACSFHAYPVNTIGDGDLHQRDLSLFGDYIRHKVTLAHEELNKPAYLGEMGTHFLPEHDARLETRAEYFDHAGKVGAEVGLNGINYWRLVEFNQNNFDQRESGDGKHTEGSTEDDVVWDTVAENAERM